MILDSVFTDKVNNKIDYDYLDLMNDDEDDNNTIVEKPKHKNILDELNKYIKNLERENEELKTNKNTLFKEEMKKIDVVLSLNFINDYRKELAKTNKKLNNLEKILKEI